MSVSPISFKDACHDGDHSRHISFNDNQPSDPGLSVISPLRGSCGQLDGNYIAPSPIFLMPIEILQDIFIQCLPGPPSSRSLYPFLEQQVYKPNSAPLLLCQICELWRQCAICLPDLWASLDVYVFMGKPLPSLGLAALWLARSGALPLSLGLYQQSDSYDNHVSAGEVLNIYTRHVHHWFNIQLDLSGPRYTRLLGSQHRSAPMLKHFRMQNSYQVHEDDLFGIFDDVPRLSNLYVSEIPNLSLDGVSPVSVPWTQLVSLKLDYVPSVGTILHILQKCQDLTDCAIKVDSNFGPLPRDPICHLHLVSLTLHIDHEQASAFLQHIALPGLARLAIYVREFLNGWPQPKFMDFLERSECRLVHLEIHDTGMRFDEFAECVSNPRLQTLKNIIVDDSRDWMWHPSVTDLALGLLTCSTFLDKSPSTTATVFTELPFAFDPVSEIIPMRLTPCGLPNLESLTFRGGCLWSADGVVADMIESRWRFRWNEVRRIKRVELDLLSSHVEDFRRLKEFCDEGLELSLLAR